jgi:hypothetical protein
VYVVHSWAVGYISDDGFIAFRYVENLTAGQGLVYNVGERVEGYSNFLWLMLLAVFRLLVPEMSLVNIAHALGISFGALTVLLVCHFSWMTRGEFRWFGLLAGSFLAVHSGFAAWGTGGLETTMFAFLVLAAVCTYAYYLQTQRGFLLVPVVFALAALTRSDALLLFGVTTVHAVVTEKRREGVLLGRRMWSSPPSTARTMGGASGTTATFCRTPSTRRLERGSISTSGAFGMSRSTFTGTVRLSSFRPFCCCCVGDESAGGIISGYWWAYTFCM